jgi:hypothetical protein
MIEFETKDEDCWVLTAEGQIIANEGSHEVKVFNFIPAGEAGVPVTAIKVEDFEEKLIPFMVCVGSSWGSRKNWPKSSLQEQVDWFEGGRGCETGRSRRRQDPGRPEIHRIRPS